MEGRYKVNVDAAFKGENAGIGVVIRDSVGDLIATLAAPVKGIHEPQFLEAVAIAKGLEYANELALTGFSMESDCLALVDRINAMAEDYSVNGHIIQMLKQDLRNPCCLGISHTRREANVPAHLLAKFACDLVECKAWIEEGPSCITSAVVADLIQ